MNRCVNKVDYITSSDAFSDKFCDFSALHNFCFRQFVAPTVKIKDENYVLTGPSVAIENNNKTVIANHG